MNMRATIIPSVVPMSFEEIGEARARYAAFATELHVDIVDGQFAPHKTWVPMPGEKLPDAKDILYEGHLMTTNPLPVGVALAMAGARRIYAHVESFAHADAARDAFAMWRSAGAKEVGIAVLLSTPLESLAPYAKLIDSVLIMSIARVGEQGIPFDERGLARINDLKNRYPRLVIAVDGGMSCETVQRAVEAGATRVVVGSALKEAADPQQEYQHLAAVCE